MKKIYSILLCFLILFSLVGCSSNKNSKNDKKNSSNQYNQIVEKAKVSGAQYEKDYFSKEQIETTSFLSDNVDSLNDIKRLTEVSVQGVVVNSEPCVIRKSSEGSAYTKVTFYVNKVLEGDQSLVGTEIIIYESGGIISKKDLGLEKKFPEMSASELSEQVVVLNDGVANSIPGTEMVLFLKKFPKNYLDVDTDFYQVFGNYLTRFDKTSNNSYEMPKPIKGRSGRSNDNSPENSNAQKVNDEVNSFVNSNID